MFDQLWEESPRVQKMREQMREQIREQLREEYYEEGKDEGIAQGRTEGRTEGELKALQRTLVNIVQVRFPDLAELAQKQVKLFNNPGALDLLFQKLLTAPDIKTARWLLESNSKQ